MTPRRGELWWVALDPALGSEIAKTRPCLVLSRNVLNEHRRTVVVVPLSSSAKAHPPITVRVNCAGRLSVAVTDQIRAIAKERLREKIGELSGNEIETICEALREILEMS